MERETQLHNDTTTERERERDSERMKEETLEQV